MVNSAWISNVANDPKAKEEFIAYLNNSQRLFTRLQEIIEVEENKIKTLETSSLTTYNQPSWAYFQAHLNGKKEILNFFRNLIEG